MIYRNYMYYEVINSQELLKRFKVLLPYFLHPKIIEDFVKII